MNSFNPEEFEDDITIVEMQSLGRGKGFTVTGEFSALSDEVLMGRIAKRLHALLGLIEGDDKKIVKPEEMRLSELERENWRLEDTVEELEDDLRSLSEELKSTRTIISEQAAEKAEYDELLELVSEALSDVYEEEFEDLDSAVRSLVDEYSDTVEEAEDLSIP